MQEGSRFSRAVNKMHDDDLAAYFKGGYVSDYIQDLAVQWMLQEATQDGSQTQLPDAA